MVATLSLERSVMALTPLSVPNSDPRPYRRGGVGEPRVWLRHLTRTCTNLRARQDIALSIPFRRCDFSPPVKHPDDETNRIVLAWR